MWTIKKNVHTVSNMKYVCLFITSGMIHIDDFTIKRERGELTEYKGLQRWGGREYKIRKKDGQVTTLEYSGEEKSAKYSYKIHLKTKNNEAKHIHALQKDWTYNWP